MVDQQIIRSPVKFHIFPIADIRVVIKYGWHEGFVGLFSMAIESTQIGPDKTIFTNYDLIAAQPQLKPIEIIGGLRLTDNTCQQAHHQNVRIHYLHIRDLSIRKNRNIKFAGQPLLMILRHSPIDDSFTVKELEKVDIGLIVDGYKDQFGIDITRFVDADSLTRYRCENTKLEFYRGIKPGDGKFYAELMNFDWYYDPWKWEHEVVAGLVSPSDELVELGSGSGGFLEALKLRKGCEGIGVEINEDAVNQGKARGVKIVHDDLESFASRNENGFDWSVSFQVLEHIENVREFLSNAVRMLKPGGNLVVSVPNNDSFIGTAFNVLNMPPHHMNRWNRESLENMATLFGLQLAKIEIEPLQSYHWKWYMNEVLESAKRDRLFKVPGLRGIFYRGLKRVLENWIKKEAKNIAGHSILAIYEKPT